MMGHIEVPENSENFYQSTLGNMLKEWGPQNSIWWWILKVMAGRVEALH
jgi:hypothetical protein